MYTLSLVFRYLLNNFQALKSQVFFVLNRILEDGHLIP